MVVAAVHSHVDAAHFVDRTLELRKRDDEHVVDGDAEQMLDRLEHEVDPAIGVGGVDAIGDYFPVWRGERDLQLARDREHRDRRLARIDPHE